MSNEGKGRSPFYPGQPVPVDLFVGRSQQIRRIVDRGAQQVALGKPVAFFVQGEYGIGKSSLAHYARFLSERKHGLLGLHATLGGASTLGDVGGAILQAAAEAGSLDPSRYERFVEWLAKYVGEQSLFGITIHADALRREGPNISKGTLPFFREVLDRLKGTDIRGIFLVLDEVNGITSNPDFAHYVKCLIDSNALLNEPVPLLLMICGTEERRREMIVRHQPVERIFDVVDITPMSEEEMMAFFTQAFGSAGIRIDEDAINVLTHYSAGFPKIMHLIGDNAFWFDSDGVISRNDSLMAVVGAAEDVGKKYVDQQVYRALRSKDYQSILRKIARTGLEVAFHKHDIEKGLTESERRKLDNFLSRMKKLNVIRSGESRGQYVFNSRMVRLYIWLNEVVKH